MMMSSREEALRIMALAGAEAIADLFKVPKRTAKKLVRQNSWLHQRIPLNEEIQALIMHARLILGPQATLKLLQYKSGKHSTMFWEVVGRRQTIKRTRLLNLIAEITLRYGWELP